MNCRSAREESGDYSEAITVYKRDYGGLNSGDIREDRERWIKLDNVNIYLDIQTIGLTAK